jgi:hypothetical protein
MTKVNGEMNNGKLINLTFYWKSLIKTIMLRLFLLNKMQSNENYYVNGINVWKDVLCLF